MPARDYGATAAFYSQLGFQPSYRDDRWMILTRGSLTLEFFLFPDVDPTSSSFSCCLRLDDLDAFVEVCRAAGIPESTQGWPRLHAPRIELSGLRIGYLIDLDGTLLRLVAHPA